MNILHAQNLSKTYPTFSGKKITALSGLNLTVEKGRTYGFIGPNGSGKSTTIKLIMGLISPTTGSITLNGLPSDSPDSRTSVGYLPENVKFYDYLTPKEFLQFISKLKTNSSPNGSAEVSNLLKRLDLEHTNKRKIRTLSKGMAQRLGIAAALVGKPEILILDEPMSGLDPLGRELLISILLELKSEGVTIFFSSHILHDVETLCDDVAMLFNGQLRFSGSVNEIMDMAYAESIVRLRPFTSTSSASSALVTEEITSHGDGTFSATLKKTDINSYLLEKLSTFEVLQVTPQQHSLQEFFVNLTSANT